MDLVFRPRKITPKKFKARVWGGDIREDEVPINALRREKEASEALRWKLDRFLSSLQPLLHYNYNCKYSFTTTATTTITTP